MRILHTSDWHLGVCFGEKSRAAEQAAFLDWLAGELDTRQVDALVIAGDVFDTPNPPAEALALYYRFLARLASADARTRSGGRRSVIVVGGNHDSPSRLDAPRDVLAALDTHVVGGHEPARGGGLADPCGQLVPLRGADGQVGLVVAAVPFLNDWRIGVRGLDGNEDEQRRGLHDAFASVYAALADKAEKAFPGIPLVGTGHLTCLRQAGTRTTEADAVPVPIHRVGMLGAMGPGVFDARYRYVALGHIHRGMAVDADERVWYSGTPIQVSAVEGADTRRVMLVDVDSAGVKVERLPVPCTRRLIQLEGPLDEVCAALTGLVVPEGELRDPYVTVKVRLERAQAQAHAALFAAAAANPTCAPHLVTIHTGVARQGGMAEDPRALLDDAVLTPEEAFLYAWRARYGAAAQPPDAVLQRFHHVLEGRVSR
jgi:exonuclease SbcD